MDCVLKDASNYEMLLPNYCFLEVVPIKLLAYITLRCGALVTWTTQNFG